MDTAIEKDTVLQAHAQNHAIAALLAAKPSCITNARFDRGELTLWIERDDIRPVCRTLQKAGYNFLVDVTCVDWYPSEPRLQVTYHILSHSLKERLRLCVLVDSLDPGMAVGQFLRARGLGSLRSALWRTSQPAPHHDA